ncbi:MAG: pectinacetylesterase family protein [Deltaproteobacteria bacterium]|nr:pectinacetylesterase family protein [Deltaproteobacteria bacterium]
MATGSIALVLGVSIIGACGGIGGNPSTADAPPGADASAPDAAPGDAGTSADIADTVQCGPNPPIGPGNTPELQKYTLDPAVFPDALCNDGTPATLYFRPYVGAANRDRWVINLHGGGACGSGPSCIARWCSCSNLTECPYAETTTNFSRSTMTNDGPDQKAADGIWLRGDAARPNPYGDYNQVELTYCTSDAWHGTRRAVSMNAINPKTNAPVTFTLHFLGARVLDGDLGVLRQAGVPALVYTRSGASIPLPDLDEASEVIVAGDSSCGEGTITNLDYIRDTLRATNVDCQGAGACPLAVYGLLDAIVGPDMSKLDFSTYVQPEVRSYADYVTLSALLPPSVGARRDASCLAAHAADPAICGDESHVVRNHVTTPFFVRMALVDQLISTNYLEAMLRNPDHTPMTLQSFGLTLHDELTAFANLPGTAEEGAAMTRAPGVFAPACTKHDTIRSTPDTFDTTITPSGGAAQTLLPVFHNWQTGTGTPTNILTQSLQPPDTVCP